MLVQCVNNNRTFHCKSVTCLISWVWKSLVLMFYNKIKIKIRKLVLQIFVLLFHLLREQQTQIDDSFVQNRQCYSQWSQRWIINIRQGKNRLPIFSLICISLSLDDNKLSISELQMFSTSIMRLQDKEKTIRDTWKYVAANSLYTSQTSVDKCCKTKYNKWNNLNILRKLTISER